MNRLKLNTTTVWLTLSVCSASICLTNIALAESPASTSSSVSSDATTPEERAAAAVDLGKKKSASGVSQLSAWLADENTLVRQSAAWALTQLGNAAEPAIPQLSQALSDRDARVRWAAATTLGNIGNKAADAVDALVHTVHDRDADVQCAAIIALRSAEITDERAVFSALCDCLRAESADVQSEALATLTHIVPRCSETTKRDLVPRLTKAMTTNNDEVRLATVVLLGDVGLAATPAITALTRATNDLDEHVESAAIRTLSRLADEIDQRWSQLDATQREALQHSCETAAKELSSLSHDESNKSRSQLANRFQQLVDGIQLAGKDTPQNRKADRNADSMSVANVAGQTLQRSEVPLIDETNDAAKNGSANSAVGSHEFWLWGLYAIIVGVGFWQLQRFVRRLGETAASSSELATANVDAANNDSVNHETRNIDTASNAKHSPNQSADEDQLIAHVVPAVVASLPAGSGVDDTSIQNKADSKPVSVPASVSKESDTVGFTTIHKPHEPVVAAPHEREQSTATTPLASNVTSESSPVAKHLERSHATDVATRRDAVNALSDIALDVTARLNRAMRDDDSVIRWRSASAVTAAHGATVPQLLAATTSTDPEVRRLAVTALQGLGGEAVAPFVQALKDQNADVRHAAATALGRIGLGAIDAIPQLIAAIQDADERVRASAAFSLSTFGRHAFEAVPALQKALGDPAAIVRSRAAFTLGQVGPAAKRAVKELARLVSDSDPMVRRNSASALGGIGADAAAAIPELLQASQDTDAAVRRCAVSVLGLIAPKAAADALKRALNDSDNEVRECARAALSSPSNMTLKVFQPQEQPAESSNAQGPAKDELAELISIIQQSNNEDARWKASQGLVEQGNRAVPAILNSMQHKNSEVRRQLAHTLGRIGKEAREAIPSLLLAMQDDDAQVRSTAADTLGKVGLVNPAMLQTLSKGLSDHDSEVRRVSAATLGRFGKYAHTTSIDLQVAALGDPETKVRRAAQAALQRITESLAKAA